MPDNLRVPPANYYRSSGPSAPSPFKPKEPVCPLRARLVKAVDILLVLAIIFCLGYSLVVQPDPKVIVPTSLYHPATVYQTAAARDLSTFKDRSKLTFDESGLVGDLEKQFPEITGAKVELPLFSQEPVIRLSITKPKFVLLSRGIKYVIGGNGVPTAEAMNFADDDNLAIVTDRSGFDVRVGSPALSAGEVAFIDQIIKQCQAAKVPIASMTLPPQVQELDLKTSDQHYSVKFYLGGDALTQIGQFLAARQQFARDHKTPSQYLDVRVPGKIFYK